MLVKFNDQDEFLAELERDPHAVTRKLVRVTTARYPVMDGALTRLAVYGTAKVYSTAIGGSEDYDLVEYVELAGDLWGGPKDEEVVERANELVFALRGKLELAGFVVGEGRYETEEKR